MASTSDFAGVQFVKVNEGSKLVFSHQGIKEKLEVLTGANSIQWAYQLNQNSQSTIGGEVVQILSCVVGPMQIEGIGTSPDEVDRIREWFLTYFERAGTVYKDAQFRDETAVLFKYPARGWSFYIQPTSFGPWEQDSTVYAIPWAVQAEIVSDNAINYLSGATMSAFTGPLSNPAFTTVGYSDPTGQGKASRFVNPQWDAANADIATTMGDNFQRLIASYLGGNFADFAFNSLINTPGVSNNDLNSAFAKEFGGGGVQVSKTTQPGTSGTAGGSQGSFVYSGSTVLAANANSQWITDVLKALSVPDSVQNHNFMYSWWGSEGGGGFSQGGHGNNANYNWLNTTLGSQFPAINSDGVRSYPDYQTGITYTVNTIKQSNMIGILNALRTGDPYQDSADAIDGLETWNSGPNKVTYAQTILGRYSTSTSTATASLTSASISPTAADSYSNPLRSLLGITPMRVDQGVDYACSADSPIYALGPGMISFAAQTNTGWPSASDSSNGGFISYTLTAGPAKGLTVYVAENITLNTALRVGSPVDTNTAVCTLHPGSPNSETGWAQPGVPAALASRVWQGHDSGGFYTAHGKNFSDLLASLGAPPGVIPDGAQEIGAPISGIPAWG